MNKKLLVLLCFAVLAGGLIMPTGRSLAQSNSDLTQSLRDQIQALLAQIQQLQAQLAAVQNGSGAQWCHTFNTNIKFGSNGDEVSALQTGLEKDGFAIPDGERPQKDGDTVLQNSFGEGTASAVTGFQEKYKDEILKPNGLQYGTGYVGAATRKKLNQLYGCGSENRVPPIGTNSGTVLYPNGGEVLTTGQPYTIRWSVGSYIVPVNIRLLDFTQGTPPISTEIVSGIDLSLGKYTWVVPPYQKLGTKYKIIIDLTSSYSGPGSAPNFDDMSDAFFTITSTGTQVNNPPKITLTSPIPASISIGQTVVFTWTASDQDGDPLKWKLMSQGGDEISSCYGLATCSQTLKWGTAGTYVVKMAVFDDKGSASEYDSAVFVSVLNSTTSTITFVSPAQGEVWKIGEAHTIKLSQPTPYPFHCLEYDFGLIDSTGNYVGAINLYQGNNKDTINWNVNDLSSAICGTSNQSIQVKPGTYKIRLTDVGVPEGQSFKILAESGYFTITSSAIQPSIKVTSSPQADASGNVTIKQGDQITITGTPSIIGQLQVDYLRAFFFDPIFNGNCTGINPWILPCIARQTGTSNFYIELYKDGQTYRSNIIHVTVIPSATLPTAN